MKNKDVCLLNNEKILNKKEVKIKKLEEELKMLKDSFLKMLNENEKEKQKKYEEMIKYQHKVRECEEIINKLSNTHDTATIKEKIYQIIWI